MILIRVISIIKRYIIAAKLQTTLVLIGGREGGADMGKEGETMEINEDLNNIIKKKMMGI